MENRGYALLPISLWHQFTQLVPICHAVFFDAAIPAQQVKAISNISTPHPPGIYVIFTAVYIQHFLESPVREGKQQVIVFVVLLMVPFCMEPKQVLIRVNQDRLIIVEGF